MQNQNRLFDDLARLATGAVGTLRDARCELEERLREQLERIVSGMDLVTREEFESVKEMAAKARQINDALERRLSKLEDLNNGSTVRKTKAQSKVRKPPRAQTRRRRNRKDN